MNGAFSSPEQCAHVPNGLWVEVDGKGDCVRYYSHGLSESDNAVALVYIGGDVMLRSAKGVRHITPIYTSTTPRKIELEMADWSAAAGRPALFLARAGIYGSSGDHNARRSHREINLLNQALDLLKDRHHITSFILTGHSAGAQIAAGLLNRRSDISAAIYSSGMLSVKQVTTFWEHRRDIPGRLLYDASRYYDPIDEIDRIDRHQAPEIYVISDPEDRVVPFFSQLFYVRRLRALGIHPHHIYARAPGPQHHLLAGHAKKVAALLAREASKQEIYRAVLELDFQSI
ncbi:alpha/beta hydrolase family protein [Variovorax soli]|uniref:alpha/beta hydrolase family protein n=1 Tax=Variovorax soli TaxID=376815 RepID=UPI001FE1649A|nr:alpha/beta hydrolase [Variovorax soli]